MKKDPQCPIPLETKNGLCLDYLKETDAPELFSLVDQNRSHLKEFLPWLNSTQGPKDSEGFIKSLQESNRLRKTLGLSVKKEGKIIGMASFNTIDWANKVGRIGYWLSQSEQGQGVMTKACQKLLSLGFKDFSLNKIEIRCATQNLASKKIPERLDFTCEGTLREAEWLYDHFVDHDVYGLLKKEWVS